jgi:hypothetical protein
MKSLFKFSGFLTLATLVLLQSCQQDEVSPELMNEQDVNAQVIALADKISQNFTQVNISGGDEHSAFEVRNEGLPTEFSSIGTFSEEERRPMPGNSVISCIVSLNLEGEQMAQVRRSFMAFNGCKLQNMHEYQRKFRSLMQQMETLRKGLVADYRAGELTREELAELLSGLRERFATELAEVKKAHAEEFNSCMRGFLARTHRILSEEQWNEFRTCMSSR